MNGVRRKIKTVMLCLPEVKRKKNHETHCFFVLRNHLNELCSNANAKQLVPAAPRRKSAQRKNGREIIYVIGSVASLPVAAGTVLVISRRNVCYLTHL